MQRLSVHHLQKVFHGQHQVVSDVSFEVNSGEIFALVGPSGCGKTTLLRMIAGFEHLEQGQIIKNGQDIGHLPAEQRRIGFVFQDWALFPHLSVWDNVRFALKGWPAAEAKERIRHVLSMVGLTIFKDRKPHMLSGGQQQRVAIARAIAPNPDIILLDEPFSSLDAALRQSTREEMRQLLKEANMSAILVTHDQEEAFSFADRLAIMRNGRIEQIGTPEEVYFAPKTAFGAQFLGKTNLITAVAKGKEAETFLGRITLTQEHQGAALLSLRPEALTLLTPSSLLGNFANTSAQGTVLEREFKGHDLTFKVLVGQKELIVQESASSPFHVGDSVRVVVRAPAVVVSKS